MSDIPVKLLLFGKAKELANMGAMNITVPEELEIGQLKELIFQVLQKFAFTIFFLLIRR